jgi:RimJ/RimL family protein N-acetyltransferase
MNRSLPLEPITLVGGRVRLELLSVDHLDALCAAGFDPSLWRWTLVHLTSREDMRSYIDDALRERDAGSALPFATVALHEERIVGSTRFGNYAPEHLRIEIGWTWVSPALQGTGLNTEAKYLMLRHAFDTLGCRRVEFKTDARNTRSRTALQKIGATEEGVLRAHMKTWTGNFRNTVYYSILDSEWPGVRERLERLLGDSTHPGRSGQEVQR